MVIGSLENKIEGLVEAMEAGGKPLSPAAERALKEAQERRAKEAAKVKAPKEINGPAGQDPTRYGDWERKGITSDF